MVALGVELDTVAGTDSERLNPAVVAGQFDRARREFGDLVGVGLEGREGHRCAGKQRVIAALVDRTIAELVLAHIDHLSAQCLRQELVAPVDTENGHVRSVEVTEPRREVADPVEVVVHRGLGATDEDAVVRPVRTGQEGGKWPSLILYTRVLASSERVRFRSAGVSPTDTSAIVIV
ncbi:MAG: hypothetical protein A07HR60_02323 [uncultured archaeon A07HR60]|nr:MAG: hypothetical protein A07HR60_02323 [uncultured archaeon A07HR60]